MKISSLFKIWSFFLIPIFLFGPILPVLAYELNDPFFSEQWYLERIHAPEAWQETTGSSEVIVAVLDAGFDLDHPDLIGQYWYNTKEIPGNKKDDDGNGFEDDVYGWDFAKGDPNPEPDVTDKFNDTVISHGTVIAGIIGAAVNNSEGIVGINHQVRIMPLRILDENGAGSTLDVRQAIVYAVQNGAQVINLSFTSDKPDERLRQTIEWAVDQGVVIVSAVGNGARDLNDQPTYPACYKSTSGKDLVIGVAATGRDDKKASFSNFGSNCTDVSAPGTNIFGTVYYDSAHLLTSTAYSSPWEGTSIAAPMVSGAAALLKARYPSLTPEQVLLSIKLSVDPVQAPTVEEKKQLGAGRLNIAGALEVAKVFAREGGLSRVEPIAHSQSFVVAEGRGSEPLIKRLNNKGEVLASFLAYNEKFRGGVSVAVGDVNGDGFEEIVTGAMKGGGPQVRVFDVNGKVLSQFFADDPSDRRGIVVGVADTNGDGIAEVFVTPEQNGTGEIKVFNQFGQLQGLIRPFGREDGTIHMAFGNMDEDPEDEIITTWSQNPHPSVRILDGTGRYVREFPISNRSALFSIASGDLTGDGRDEIFLSSSRTNIPFVEIYSSLGVLERTFQTFSSSMRAGISTCVGDIDQNGRAEVYVAPQIGAGPHLQIYNQDASLISSFFAFDATDRAGITCAIWHP